MGGTTARALLRPPRLSPASEALPPYSYPAAVGRYLLAHLQAWQLPPQEFRGCMPLADPTTFVVLTCRRALERLSHTWCRQLPSAAPAVRANAHRQG